MKPSIASKAHAQWEDDLDARDKARDKFIAREWFDGDLMHYLGEGLAFAPMTQYDAISDAIRANDGPELLRLIRDVIETQITETAEERYK